MSRRPESVYQKWKDVLIAMEQAGTCSPERAKQQMAAVDFALLREETLRHIAIKRKNQGLHGNDWWPALGLISGVLLLLVHFGFDVRWWPSVCVSVLAAWTVNSILFALERLEKLSARSVDMGAYALSLWIAEQRSVPLYEARAEVEYMRHIELDFEEGLLDRDTLSFPYQISTECLFGPACEKCDGTTDGRPGGSKQWPCLHKCHHQK